ncbi:MAG: YihY/virulence factor BrkB family protein [Chloroflexota bacterium]
MTIFRKLVAFIRRTFQLWGEAKAARKAAALSYYAMLSLSPSLVLAIAIAAPLFAEQTVEAEIVELVGEFTSQEVGDTVAGLIENASSSETGFAATIIGVVILIFGASSVFSQLYDTINEMWGIPINRRSGFLYTLFQRAVGIGMVLILSLILLSLMIFSTILTLFAELISSWVSVTPTFLFYIERFFSLLLMPIVFATMFRFLPDIHVKWSDVIGAAIVTAVLITFGRSLIEIYINLSSTSAVYGAAGSLVILLTWIYLTSMIVFYGAAFSRAYAEMFGSQKSGEEVG